MARPRVVRAMLALAIILLGACLWGFGPGVFSAERAEVAGRPARLAPAKGNEAVPRLLLLEAEGVVNPAMADLTDSALGRAEKEGYAALIIKLDTPGGLDISMRRMVKGIMNSAVPVVVWVAPSGARAASAGVVVTLAADVAVMAPGTNIGAASPVTMGGGDLPKTMARKVVNDMVAYVRSIAVKRGRNADWAERAVRQAVSTPADEAVRLRVVNFEAADVPSLLSRLDDFGLTDRQGRRLHLTGARVVKLEEGLRSRILRTICDPNIAYLLLMVGLAGLYFEFSTPGAILPGVVGAISLILAFDSLQTIPVSQAGAALVVLALVLFIAEIKIISHGVLGAGGAVALVLGSMMLFNSPELHMRVSLGIILPVAVAFALFFAAVVRLAVKAHSAKPRTGERGIVGEVGRVVSAIDGQGRVFVHGEYWNATADAPIEVVGARVRVVGIEDLVLKVEKAAGRL
ncbi:MAG: nodulation protein NfeD [Pseudomonadota bacterium]